MFDRYAYLLAAAAAAGVINAVAGGGTLLTFPALHAALRASAAAGVMANATSTVALVPGSLGGLWGYRREIRGAGRWLALLIPPSLAGGLVGSLAVVLWPERFESLIPWLILAATAIFAAQPCLARWLRSSPHAPATRRGLAAAVVFQFLVAVYGGYFGGGIGILMLSGLALLGLSDVHQMNGIKTLLAALLNGVSAVVFILGGRVHWPFALSMAAAAVCGGYLGASVARRLNRQFVRGIVVTIGFSLTVWYFYRQASGRN